jgi:uncharacterized tellurite resistance protein B-like protein
MLDIRSFFQRKMQPAATAGAGGPRDPREDPVKLAACALLVELAHADEEFSAPEREHIAAALVRQFGVAPEAVDDMIALAEDANRRAVDHFQFTRLIAAHYDLSQKMVLAEIMWGLVAADGTVAEHEAYLVRKISNLLDLEPGYLSEAKNRATGASGPRDSADPGSGRPNSGQPDSGERQIGR